MHTQALTHGWLVRSKHLSDDASHLPVFGDATVNAAILSNIEICLFVLPLNALVEACLRQLVKQVDSVLHLLLRHAKDLLPVDRGSTTFARHGDRIRRRDAQSRDQREQRQANKQSKHDDRVGQ